MAGFNSSHAGLWRQLKSSVEGTRVMRGEEVGNYIYQLGMEAV